ncbi:MAG TPA: hypothetical protein VF637_14150 [Sphingomicrobium sp.]|jgi:hypothetical protein
MNRAELFEAVKPFVPEPGYGDPANVAAVDTLFANLAQGAGGWRDPAAGLERHASRQTRGERVSDRQWSGDINRCAAAGLGRAAGNDHLHLGRFRHAARGWHDARGA